MAGLSCLAVSIGTILLHCILASLARRRVAKIDRALPRELFNEAIATAELCACCFELIVGELLATHSKFERWNFSMCPNFRYCQNEQPQRNSPNLG